MGDRHRLGHWDKWFTIHEKWLEDPPATLTEGAHADRENRDAGHGEQDRVDGRLASRRPASWCCRGTGMAGVKAQFTFDHRPDGERFARSRWPAISRAQLIKGALGKAVEKDGLKQLDKTLDQLDALASAGR